jgi:hypothetical protein
LRRTFQRQGTLPSVPGQKAAAQYFFPASTPTVALICSNVTLPVPHQQKLKIIVY